MERQSWPWRRKSLDKSPGESDSSASASANSQCFLDDQVLLHMIIFFLRNLFLYLCMLELFWFQ
jgi:hypothetical protein